MVNIFSQAWCAASKALIMLSRVSHDKILLEVALQLDIHHSTGCCLSVCKHVHNGVCCFIIAQHHNSTSVSIIAPTPHILVSIQVGGGTKCRVT